jgi:uncharacterized protein (TIRG00374 family)
LEDQQSNDNIEKAKGLLNYKLIRRGAIIFFAITLIAFTTLFLYGNTGESLAELRKIKAYYIPIILGLVFFDWWIGGWRNTIFVRKVMPNASQRICFDANLANIFMGAVTPSQTGGGPMHLYMLYRKGLQLTHGIALSVINFISSIIFFITSSGLALWYLKGAEINSTLFTLIKSGYTIFTSLFLFILFGMIAPQILSRAISKFGGTIAGLFKNKKEKILNGVSSVNEKLFEYNATIKLFLRENPILFPYSLGITFIMYFNKFLVAFMIVKGLGYDGDFWSIISVQAITFFLLYFAPTPGGSGVAELSIATLMTPFIPALGITSFTILHRSFLLILPAIFGAFVVLKELKRHSEE